jgi:hypothetical protein
MQVEMGGGGGGEGGGSAAAAYEGGGAEGEGEGETQTEGGLWPLRLKKGVKVGLKLLVHEALSY